MFQKILEKLPFWMAVDQAMAEKAEEFRAKGGEIYLNEKGEKREPID